MCPHCKFRSKQKGCGQLQWIRHRAMVSWPQNTKGLAMPHWLAPGDSGKARRGRCTLEPTVSPQNRLSHMKQWVKNFLFLFLLWNLPWQRASGLGENRLFGAAWLKMKGGRAWAASVACSYWVHGLFGCEADRGSKTSLSPVFY